MSRCSASSSPSLVPFAVQTGAKAPGFSPTAPEFTAETDSPLEENGFKLPVPREISSGFEASAELRPIDRRRGGIIRVFGRMSSQPIEHKR